MPDTSKSIPGVRQHQRQTGIPSARQMRNIGHEINRLSMSQDLTKTPTGYRYSGSGAVSEPWTFKHSISGAVVTISAGTISYGSVDIDVAEGDVTLTGTPEFVYVRLTRVDQSTTIGHASTRPVSDSTYAYFILVSFTATAGVYSLSKIHHRGDIFLQVPMQ